MYHWTVTAWVDEEGHGRHAFRVSVDADFLRMAKTCATKCDKKWAQESARILARMAGYKVADSVDLLVFGPLGIQQINHPYGNGCWLSLDTRSLGSDSANFNTKNSDRADQQTFLMRVWFWWADYVSARI